MARKLRNRPRNNSVSENEFGAGVKPPQQPADNIGEPTAIDPHIAMRQTQRQIKALNEPILIKDSSSAVGGAAKKSTPGNRSLKDDKPPKKRIKGERSPDNSQPARKLAKTEQTKQALPQLKNSRIVKTWDNFIVIRASAKDSDETLARLKELKSVALSYLEDDEQLTTMDLFEVLSAFKQPDVLRRIEMHIRSCLRARGASNAQMNKIGARLTALPFSMEHAAEQLGAAGDGDSEPYPGQCTQCSHRRAELTRC